MKLLIVSTDLMLVSRLEGLARSLDLAAVQAADLTAAIALCDDQTSVAIVDLQTAGLNIAELNSQLKQANGAVRVVASGPHVHTERLAAAEAAGCDLVVSRGQLDREGSALISALLQP